MKKNNKEQRNLPVAITPSTPTSPLPQLTPRARSFLHLGNDSTSHEEISKMGNIEYAPQIINDAGGVFNLEKLRGVGKDNNKFLAEAKLQIDKLWKSAVGFHRIVSLSLSVFKANPTLLRIFMELPCAPILIIQKNGG